MANASVQIDWQNALKRPEFLTPNCTQPTVSQLLAEALRSLNCISDRRNWLTCSMFVGNIIFFIFFIYFLQRFYEYNMLTLQLLWLVGLNQNIVWEIYIHRYMSHRSFAFRNRYVKFLVKFWACRDYPDEIHVLPHIVHHQYSDTYLDPYNAKFGWFNCFIADFVYHSVSRNLSREQYEAIAKIFDGEFFYVNTYEQYKKWGTFCHPLGVYIELLLSHLFWGSVLYLLGGWLIVIGAMASRFLQGILFSRNANYILHNCGKETLGRTSFNRKDEYATNNFIYCPLSNWHANHHLYPRSAITGFLFYQIDFTGLILKSLNALSLVTNMQNSKADFINDYYKPEKLKIKNQVNTHSI